MLQIVHADTRRIFHLWVKVLSYWLVGIFSDSGKKGGGDENSKFWFLRRDWTETFIFVSVPDSPQTTFLSLQPRKATLQKDHFIAALWWTHFEKTLFLKELRYKKTPRFWVCENRQLWVCILWKIAREDETVHASIKVPPWNDVLMRLLSLNPNSK